MTAIVVRFVVFDINCVIIVIFEPVIGCFFFFRHGAPVMTINVLDGRNFPLDTHPAASAEQLLGQEHGHRLLVCSEEQVKSFHLPTLRPGRHKFKLTAMEGSHIRRAQLMVLQSTGEPQRQESFVGVITNHGELQAYATHTLRRVLNVQCIRRDDLK